MKAKQRTEEEMRELRFQRYDERRRILQELVDRHEEELERIKADGTK